MGEPTALPTRLSSRADGKSLPEIHAETARDFLDPERLGYVEEAPDRVAGFLGHGLGGAPFSDRWDTDSDPSGRWSLERLELIGLLRRETPLAYVTAELPRMDALAEAPTRPLNAFEAEALKALRGSDDVVVTESESPEGVRLAMVGAVRAGDGCLECHGVPRGTLLGAFSYELSRAGDAAATPHARSRPSAGG